MVTIEQERIEYVNLINQYPQLAAEVLCWDSVSAVLADLDELNKEDRTTEWLLAQIDLRVQFLYEQIPGLSGSPIALQMQEKISNFRRSVLAYQHLRAYNSGRPYLNCVLVPPCPYHS